MSTDLTALIVAGLGVGGTLASAVLTQQVSIRARRQELAAIRIERADERTDDAKQAALYERRDSYVTMNASARAYRQALKNVLYDSGAEYVTALEQARAEFTSGYAEGQLIATDGVLEVAASVSAKLASAYGEARRLTRPNPAPGDSDAARQNLREHLDGPLLEEIHRFREVMRIDLGVAEAGRD